MIQQQDDSYHFVMNLSSQLRHLPAAKRVLTQAKLLQIVDPMTIFIILLVFNEIIIKCILFA